MSKFKVNKRLTSYTPQYNLVETLLGGTDSMRAAGTAYLPREPAETVENYNLRLARSVLFPQYEKTVDSSVGKIYASQINKEISEQLVPLSNDMDGEGTSLTGFAKQITTNAIHYGITYVLIDMPNESSEFNVAEIYPYCVEIKATNVVDINYIYSGKYVELTKFSYIETVDEDGKSIDQVREFITSEDGVVWSITRKDKSNKEYIYDFGKQVGVTTIPIVPVYGNKTLPFYGKPKLYNLALLNISHWRAYSDYLNIVHMVQCPLLVITGYEPTVDENGAQRQIAISPNSVFTTSSPTGDVKWVEVTGGSVNVGKQAIEDIENKMAVLGLELTTKSNMPETATGRLLDAATANSILTSIALDVESALIMIFLYAAEYLKLNAPTIDISIDTSYTVFDNSDFEKLIKLYEIGAVKSEEVLDWVKKHNII